MWSYLCNLFVRVTYVVLRSGGQPGLRLLLFSVVPYFGAKFIFELFSKIMRILLDICVHIFIHKDRRYTFLRRTGKADDKQNELNSSQQLREMKWNSFDRSLCKLQMLSVVIVSNHIITNVMRIVSWLIIRCQTSKNVECLLNKLPPSSLVSSFSIYPSTLLSSWTSSSLIAAKWSSSIWFPCPRSSYYALLLSSQNMAQPSQFSTFYNCHKIWIRTQVSNFSVCSFQFVIGRYRPNM